MTKTAQKTEIIDYRGFTITLAEESHCAIIYFNGKFIGCVAGDVKADFTNNRIEKSKEIIDFSLDTQ